MYRSDPSFLPVINPEKEKRRIVKFIKKTFVSQNVKKAVIGLSGGIDSTVSFYLLRESLPPENIIVAHLYYDKPLISELETVLKFLKFPKKNIYMLSIKPAVDEVAQLLGVGKSDHDQLRLGNIKARMRMIALFDLAKKHAGMVVGTENKSEHLLGYFTRFGDQASDIEPIEHLYKTQVFQMAKYLGIPDEIINKHPSAGLWEGQTDEKEFGFTYEEADQVLYLSLEKKLSVKKIAKRGLKNAKKILEWHSQNLFKHNTPYLI